MWYSRRVVLRSTLLLLAARGSMNVSSKLFFKREPSVNMDVVTTFPEQMTLEKWEKIKGTLVDQSFNDLVRSMVQNNEILSQHTEFHGTYAVWKVVFKDLIASEKWISEVNRNKMVYNSLCRETGYRIESYLS